VVIERELFRQPDSSELAIIFLLAITPQKSRLAPDAQGGRVRFYCIQKTSIGLPKMGPGMRKIRSEIGTLRNIRSENARSFVTIRLDTAVTLLLSEIKIHSLHLFEHRPHDTLRPCRSVGTSER